MKITYILFLVLLITCTISQNLLHEWVTLEYAWESPEQRSHYVQEGLFIVDNNALAGVKSYMGVTYVTVPRWLPGVPSTLNVVVEGDNGPVLKPYPSWDMQEIGNPNALQYVQSMEIDSRGWMWILDVGRLNLFLDEDEIINGPPKLVIWDINNNCKIREFVFPDDILPWNNSFANDIVVDETQGFAYISDTWDEGGIVIYSFNKNMARRFDDVSCQGNDSNVVEINGITYDQLTLPTDGIALSHDTKTLYYCQISRNILWSVPTNLLQNFQLPNSVIAQSVKNLGIKGFSDGMACDNMGNLYYGRYTENAVYKWNTTQSLSSAQAIALSDKIMQWPDTFAFDGLGNLLFTSNKLQLLLSGTMIFDGSDGANFRIWSVNVSANSYLTGKPLPPSLPCQLEDPDICFY